MSVESAKGLVHSNIIVALSRLRFGHSSWPFAIYKCNYSIVLGGTPNNL